MRSMRFSAAPNHRPRPPSTSLRSGWRRAATALPELVRKDQDLATEADALDKAIVAAVSRDPSKRDVASERRSQGPDCRHSRRARDLAKTLAVEFPNYAALSNPLPMTAREIQALLSGDEAMVLFAVTDRRAMSLR